MLLNGNFRRASGRVLAALVVLSAQPAASETTRADQDGELLAVLRSAADHGLPVNDGVLDSVEHGLSGDLVAREAARQVLRSQLLAYASAQHGGRIRLGHFPRLWAVRPTMFEAAAELGEAERDGRVLEWTRSLPPATTAYTELARVYARYRRVAREGGWPELPLATDLAHPAAREALQRRLVVEDPPRPAASRTSADAELSSAIRRAQARYGLAETGSLDAGLIRELNVPVIARLRQIEVNLERRRWTRGPAPSFRLELNTADARLRLFDGEGPPISMRAIVGKPSTPTPAFRDRVTAVILNPPWNVPADIAARELWPAFRKDPTLMGKRGFVRTEAGGLMQKPGPGCALGVLKFDLQNSFGVYLHDTSQPSLFARDARYLSHGCMRLEQPKTLAARLLRARSRWNVDRLDMALASGRSERIALDPAPPLEVGYWTAWVEEGAVRFRPDPYRWDARLRSLLLQAAAEPVVRSGAGLAESVH